MIPAPELQAPCFHAASILVPLAIMCAVLVVAWMAELIKHRSAGERRTMMRLSLFAQGVDVSAHINMQGFTGCLCIVGMVTQTAPSGARGHSILLTRSAVESALPSLLGMAVDYKVGWDGHDARQKCGIITEAWLEDNKLMVSGYIYRRDFPEIEEFTTTHDVGMSYEAQNCHVRDIREKVWTLDKVEFTGAAILLREKAAYNESSFEVHP
jgi:hypothetical protein